jgi:hypothetical protein
MYRKYTKFDIRFGVADWPVLGVTKMLGHFGLQGTRHQHLGKLLQQAILADQVFRLL